MLKEKMPEPDEPSSMTPPKSQNIGNGGLLNTIKKAIFKHKNGGETLRDVIEEYIEETANEDKELPSVAQHEKSLITNVLKLREKTVVDVMIPRADIAAIDINESQESKTWSFVVRLFYSSLFICYNEASSATVFRR